MGKIVAEQVLKQADSPYSGVLEFEYDIPSNNPNDRVTMLDIECWVKQDLVLFNFFKKPVAIDEVLGPESGFTPQVVRNILIQEYLGRLLNCSRLLPGQVKLDHICRFNLDLKMAGHCEQFRVNMTTWAWQIYQDKLKSGELYRSREEIQKASSNRVSSSDWLKQGEKYDAVLNVQPTVNQTLFKQVRKVVNSLPQVQGTRVLVQQGYGRTILFHIVSSEHI